MELEYRPCASEADGAAILTAFEQQVIPAKMREQLKVPPDESKGQPAIADDSPADVRTALKYIAAFTQHELL